MATDGNLGRAAGIMRGDPFSVFVLSADASGNGVEVVPAVSGKTPYVLGSQFSNKHSGTLNFYLCHTAGAAGKTQISVTEYKAATSHTVPQDYDVPIAGASGQNIGFVASGAGNIECHVWGYYA